MPSAAGCLAHALLCDALLFLLQKLWLESSLFVTAAHPKKPALFTLILLTSINVVTLNMFLPSLSHMAEDFGVSAGIMGWSFSGYLLVIAAMQLIVAPLSDRFGRLPVLIACFVVYIPASLGCMFAPNIEIFFVCRLLQGGIIGAVGLTHAIIRDTEPNAELAASRLATVVMVMAIMPMLAPLLGGVVADLFGWRSNFLLMALFGSFILFLVLTTLEETNLQKSSTLQQQWKDLPTLLQSYRYWGFALTIVLNVGVFYFFLVGMPILGKENFGLNRTAIGLLLAYMPLGYMIGNSIVRLTSSRLGIPTLLLTGRLLGVLSIVMVIGLQWLEQSNPFLLFSPLVLIGLANGLIMPTSTSGAVSVNPRLAGTASGMTGSMTQLFGAGLTAVGGFALNATSSVSFMLYVMLALAAFGVLPALLLHVGQHRDSATPLTD